MRTLGQAAYITPDAHPLKSYFKDRVINNINYYDTAYRVNTGAYHNQLGVVLITDDVLSKKIRPWMDDFFTWSVGYLNELGFNQAESLNFFNWKKQFVIGRMNAPVTPSDFCWITASAYTITIRPPTNDTMFTTFSDVYTNSFAINGIGGTLSSKTCASTEMAQWLTDNANGAGDFDNWGSGTWSAKQMLGNADQPIGFPANMQPALAVSVTSASSTEWLTYLSRDWKPNYTAQPQFAIVPRN